MAELPQQILDLLTTQDGVVTRRQLVSAEVSKAAIRWNAGRNWTVLLPRTYLLSRDQPTEHQRLVAAQLWAGRRSYLAGATAAALHGIKAADDAGELVHLLTPAPGATRRHGWAVVRRTVIADHHMVTDKGLRLSSPARAAVDAAFAARSARSREAILIEAVQRRLATVEELHEWICRLRERDAHRLLSALEAAGSGAWSVPEHELLTLIAESDVLPEPWANPTLHGPDGAQLLSPDVWFDEVGLAVMVHSHQYHSQGEQWTTTVERDGDLTRVGVVVVGVTPHGLRSDRAGTLRRLEDTYRTAERRPRPDVNAGRRAA